MSTTLILAIIIIALIILALLLKPSKKKSKFKKSDTKETNYKYQKRNLLTNNECAFYKALYPIALKTDLILFTKVRLSDLISPQKGESNWQASFNKIQSKHVDFVLCDNERVNPVLVIELDDKTHDREGRQQRDAFVDQSLKSAGIPILHARNANKLEENIVSLLSSKTPSLK